MSTVVSVRFRSGCKTYYFDPRDLLVRTGQDIIVETAQGPEYAQCAEGNHDVPEETVVAPLRSVLRIATENDRRTVAYNHTREKEAFDICRKRIEAHALEMKLVRAECSFDGSKILFFFTADGRVDFRELVKDLAGAFRSRIELRQIGVRDEAKMLGGLGICGRPFCCNAYMDEFVPVSIKMAKVQNLSLNPTKISGTCGRLMCCLKYEQDAYMDAASRLPKAESFVLTPDGPGNVSDINLLKETVTVRLDDHTESPRCYHNCEVCVLRSGKGNRDGITIPSQRPARYVAPVTEEESAQNWDALLPETVPAAEEPVPCRSRSRRERSGGRNGENVEQKKFADKDTSPERETASGKSSSRRRHRAGNRSKGTGNPVGTQSGHNTPAPQPKPAQAAAPAAGEPPKSKSRHRGGRRHGGHSHGGSTQSEG